MNETILPNLTFLSTDNNFTIQDDFILPKYTVLVGKNNSGKSWMLKSLYEKLQQNQSPANAYYISPERFGALQRNSNLEDVGHSNRLGKDKEKLNNQSLDFITDSVSSFNSLIGQLNRNQIESKKILNNFLEHLNNKISGIEFSYTDSSESTPFNFKINGKYPDPERDKLSSGTNQLIALMTSVMYFLYSKKYTENALLLLDEPDVHIHSDLQFQFIKFVISVTKETNHKVIIATHSSSIISAFIDTNDAYVATKNSNKLNFYSVDTYLKKLLPSIGSHSLSHTFNQSPLLLVEGADDELVWQFAIRNSNENKKINFHIIETGSKDEMSKYEKLINDIGGQMFDSPKIYEIRDKDDSTVSLTDVGFIKRSLLSCHEVENLLLSNEVISMLGYQNYEQALIKIKDNFTTCRFSDSNKHEGNCKICKVVEQLKGNTFDRYGADLKGSENTIIYFLKQENRLPWELLVGKAIGKNLDKKMILLSTEGSIYHMLGEKISSWLP